MHVNHQDSYKTLSQLAVDGQTYHYFSLKKAEENGLKNISKLPFTLKILLENLLRHEGGKTVRSEDCQAVAEWLTTRRSSHEIAYRPARVLMQDFTGVPAVVDLAAMRDAVVRLGGKADQINPLTRVDLIIDHSVQVDAFAKQEAFATNVQMEMQRNKERYEFLRWGQSAFDNFHVVPPGTGICHQVNLEYLAKAVWHADVDGKQYAYPDTLVGTDSHTTMINGLGVLGWGVGGIEAEAAMLGQPISMLIPEVIGFKLTGKLREGVTATDLVLTVTQMLREKGVVGKFVEFYGSGLQELTLPDRATVANMSPEYGATCGFFPVDEETINYLRLTGRDEHTMALVKAYCQAQGLWHSPNTPEPVFTDTLTLDLDEVETALAGPKRPQDRVRLADMPTVTLEAIKKMGQVEEVDKRYPLNGNSQDLGHGDVVIAAITSCTNTSNPSVLMAAGLVAKKALEKGLTRKPWVKSSLAPGSKVVTDYLEKAGLQAPLNALGFHLVGYGCTTCIGNSGPLIDVVGEAVDQHNLVVCSVLSGNRNFEGRVHPQVKANWLASPPLVVAYALAGSTRIDLRTDPLGQDKAGNPIFLKDIWPSNDEVAAEVAKVDGDMFRHEYANVFKGDEQWQNMTISGGETFGWPQESTYIQKPPFFKTMHEKPNPIEDIKNARILALLGDSVTTDHISPAGSFAKESCAGEYLVSQGVNPLSFNSYGSRRGNHEVLMRGTFANIRIRNEMVPGVEGGFTKHIPTGEVMAIYDAAMRYQEEGTPLVVIAGKEYGTGSSRDWAAKGTLLLGVKAVVAESYERIHRSNLIGMGVMPLTFTAGATRKSLKLEGNEVITIEGLSGELHPNMHLTMHIKRADGSEAESELKSRIDTENELRYYQHGGILQYVLRNILAS